MGTTPVLAKLRIRSENQRFRGTDDPETPDYDAYQDVAAGMQPEDNERTAQASELSREE